MTLVTLLQNASEEDIKNVHVQRLWYFLPPESVLIAQFKIEQMLHIP